MKRTKELTRRRHISHEQIMTLVPEGSRVLDLGCGDGELLLNLKQRKNISGSGLDIEEKSILACTDKGIPAIQRNIDDGLAIFPDKSFDIAILSQTLQVVRNPVYVLDEMLRVAGKAIISFPNFAYFPTRLQLLFSGRMPVHKELPYEWYNTPNIHFCTRKDFVVLCREREISILKEVALKNRHPIGTFMANMRATDMCYLIERESLTP